MSVIYAVTSLLHRVKPLGQSLLALARGEITALAALMILAGGVAMFADLAEDLGEDETRAFDMRVLTVLHPGPDPANPIGPAWLDRAAQDFSALGSVAILFTIAVVVVGFLLMQKRALQACLLALALGGGLALSETMKFVFERTRPPDIYHAAGALNASFPSGHALLSTVFYLTLGAMLARLVPRRREKLYALGIALTLALLVGVTRIYLGVHWASDVFAGWSLGAAWAMACWLLEWAIERKVDPAAVDKATRS
jgi:undecaprenyl-diphosphatase